VTLVFPANLAKGHCVQAGLPYRHLTISGEGRENRDRCPADIWVMGLGPEHRTICLRYPAREA
jgi:hypothetical protein